MLKSVVTNLQKIFIDQYCATIAPYHLLFNEQFMERYTSFYSWEQFQQNSYLDTSNIKNLINSNKEEWDQFVAQTTHFNNWSEMLNKAEEHYVLERSCGPYQFM
ncbi:hypothetical protein [Alkalihalobacterium elongatum]|uniref:hypothetical protein n=1 Tax=Alkalihalobacterium elongatum TaxID=2675466 RepID=UPI001C1FE3C1|nr:hypothetical protein [Alkalihalobacterium elongatum]